LTNDARCLDIFTFVRQEQCATGRAPITQLSRLIEGLPQQPVGEAGWVRWQVRGEIPRSGYYLHESLLHLHVQAEPVLICQRCNTPFVYPVDTTVVLQLVRSEDELDINDLSGRMLEENLLIPQPEKVVGSFHFDLLAQVEDELILSVPYVPVHDICPVTPYKRDQPEEKLAAKRLSPFAMLEQLKQKR
jgi:uncharacterized protein